MNKLLITSIVSLLFLNLSFGQIPKEAFPLTNSLYDLWYNGETEKAVQNSLELYRLYPPFFIDNIHSGLAQILPSDKRLNCINYLEQLQLKRNEEVNKIIAPIYLWSQALVASEAQELTTIREALGRIKEDSADYDSKRERYRLLTLAELDNKNAIESNHRIELVNQIISSLESYPYLTEPVADREEGQKRAWHRYLLAYSYDYLFSYVSDKEEYLKKASAFSPDLNDRLNQPAYFYDAAILTGKANPDQVGYQLKYQKYLTDHNREAEALNLLSEIAFLNPSDKNIESLREHYTNAPKELPFKEYWENFIHSKGKAVPKVKIKFDDDALDLTGKIDSWIYIDVWGTWCRPCLVELPDLQSFYLANQQTESAELKIYTFSFKSQNLADFMIQHKYTFPVSEIDQQTNDLFEVSGYPTKILITPKGSFIKIPYGADWKACIKNYTLMSLKS